MTIIIIFFLSSLGSTAISQLFFFFDKKKKKAESKIKLHHSTGVSLSKVRVGSEPESFT